MLQVELEDEKRSHAETESDLEISVKMNEAVQKDLDDAIAGSEKTDGTSLELEDERSARHAAEAALEQTERALEEVTVVP